MVLQFNVKGESRKAMVKAVEQILGTKAKYLGVPSMAYEIGDFVIGKYGELEFAGFNDMGERDAVIEACVEATGVKPAELEENSMESKTALDIATQSEIAELTVSLPKEKVDLDKLQSLLDAKGDLIKKALGAKTLEYEEGAYEVRFPWFDEVAPDEALTYTKFISALCEMTIKQKRITAKPGHNENEKYSFRCFLLRLGFIGDEYKADRKILLRNLSGSSAFKNGGGK